MTRTWTFPAVSLPMGTQSTRDRFGLVERGRSVEVCRQPELDVIVTTDFRDGSPTIVVNDPFAPPDWWTFRVEAGPVGGYALFDGYGELVGAADSLANLLHPTIFAEHMEQCSARDVEALR